MKPIAGFTQPGDLVFDVGANVGDWTVMMSNRGCRVVAIEPDPDLADELSDRVERLALKDVIVLNKAASASRGEAVLYRSADPGLNSLHRKWVTAHDRVRKYPGRISSRAPVRVGTVPLSSIVDQFGSPAFIKVDTEGSDDRVLYGLDGNYPPALSFEYHGGAYPVEDGGSTVACLTLLGDAFRYRLAQHETEWVTSWLKSSEVFAALPHMTWGDVYAKSVV